VKRLHDVSCHLFCVACRVIYRKHIFLGDILWSAMGGKQGGSLYAHVNDKSTYFGNLFNDSSPIIGHVASSRPEDQVLAVTLYQKNEEIKVTLMDLQGFYKTLPIKGVREYFCCIFRALRDTCLVGCSLLALLSCTSNG